MSTTAADCLVCVSHLAPSNVEWLWPGRLPLGKLTLLDGDPQEGKSLLTLDWAARLTTARPWPDGATIPEPVPVLLLAGEDNAEDTILPRLLAAGADLNFVHLLRRRANANGAFQPLIFPDDTDLLYDALWKTSARFVVADPIVSYLGPSAALTGAQVRKALTPLADVAQRARANLTMVRHLNKSAGRQSALYRGAGSIQVIAAARVALLVGRDSDDSDLRLLACNKNNLAPPPPTLAYRICRDDLGRPFLDWAGEVPTRPDDLVLAGGVYYGASLNRAIQFLRDTLSLDSRPRKEVCDLARDAGISPRTLYRARAELHVVSCHIHEHGRMVCHWRIQDGATPEEEIANLFKRISQSAEQDDEQPGATT